MKLIEWAQATARHLQSDICSSPQAAGLSQDQVQQVLSAAVETLCHELNGGGYLHIQRLGILRTVQRGPRLVANNLTHSGPSRQHIPTRRSVRFQPASALLLLLNDNLNQGEE